LCRCNEIKKEILSGQSTIAVQIVSIVQLVWFALNSTLMSCRQSGQCCGVFLFAHTGISCLLLAAVVIKRRWMLIGGVLLWWCAMANLLVIFAY